MLALPIILAPDLAQTPAYKFELPKQSKARQLAPTHLAALREAALTGSNAQVAAYARADIEAHWPHLHERIVVAQGNGPDETDWSVFYRDFTRAWATATKYQINQPPAELHQSVSTAYHVVRKANEGGTMVTFPASVDGHSIPVIALPLAACRACVNEQLPATPQNCHPLHPDTPYFEGLYRLRNIYHEEAHALRMLRGLYRPQTDQDIHKEELIAELFGDARLVQTLGVPGWNVARRGQVLLPITPSKSRHYYAVRGRDMMLRWLEQNQKSLSATHPDELLYKATEFAEKTLLSSQTLVELQRVEGQQGLLRFDSGQRLKLAEAAGDTESEDVHDAKGCRWNYPSSLRVMDSDAVRRGTPPGAALQDILNHNPLRSPALRTAEPFAIDKRRNEQISAIIDFNKNHRPMACRALTASDVIAADLWLPAKPSPPRPAGSPAVAAAPACPQ